VQIETQQDRLAAKQQCVASGKAELEQFLQLVSWMQVLLRLKISQKSVGLDNLEFLDQIAQYLALVLLFSLSYSEKISQQLEGKLLDHLGLVKRFRQKHKLIEIQQDQ